MGKRKKLENKIKRLQKELEAIENGKPKPSKPKTNNKVKPTPNKKQGSKPPQTAKKSNKQKNTSKPKNVKPAEKDLAKFKPKIIKNEQLKEVVIYTDGSCDNIWTKKGGCSCILIYNGHKKLLCDYFEDTTNNRMEMQAVIIGLQALKERCKVTVYCDNKYVIDAFEKGWIYRWLLTDFDKGKKHEIKNKDLWLELYNLYMKHSVKFIWVKGHSGNKYNEICDYYADFNKAEMFGKKEKTV